VEDLGVSEKHKKRIGATDYFNAGVMVVDCKKWKAQNITEESFRFLKSKKNFIEFADQDGLNFALRDKWKKAPLEWNVVTRLAIYRFIPFLLESSRRKEIDFA